jgi:rhamnosyltransferase
MGYEATVVLLTFNGDEYLDDVLKAVFRQKTSKKFEVLVIDSGSTDETLEIVKKYSKVRLHQIPNSEFGHGKTRNLAMSLADSPFVIFLTQDAVPAHDQWLDYMLEPFSISDKVVCVFGKQIPRPNCFVTIKREVSSVFRSFGNDGSISLQRQTPLTDSLGITNSFMSDVNSAVRKSLHSEIPFRDLNYAEDQVLGIEVLSKGFLKAYAPLGSVYHSHNYSLRKYYRRKFDEYVGLRQSTGFIAAADFRELILGTLKSTFQDYIFLVRDHEMSLTEKVHDFFLVPAYNLGLRLAIRKAAHSIKDEDIRRHSLEFSTRHKIPKQSKK